MAPSQIKPNQGGLLQRGNANIAPSQIKPNIDLFLQGFFWLILKSVTALEELTHAKHQKPQNPHNSTKNVCFFLRMPS